MPPKAAARIQDWSWVGSVASVEGITPQLRRQAAGLSGPATQRVCAYKFDNLKRAQTVESDEGDISEASVVILKDQKEKDRACQARRCRTNPRCYNHLGGSEWLEDGRSKFVNEHIGHEVGVREGPAGLKNYGATCYANAFLQVWFNNVAFRNGVYDAVGEQRNALFHVAHIFGMLQHSQRPVVDPGALIDALQLNKGTQQDASEFSKLFMDLLSTNFARAGAPSFVKDQFQGILEYRTTCNTCGYISSFDNPVFELEVTLKDKASLESRVKHMLLPEVLDGDNKYQCRDCNSKQPATRSVHIKSLPPVLHFSLMRFVYDIHGGDRKKAKAAITYPQMLMLNGHEYHLRGVVSHEGSSAKHGHFVCEVFNEEDGEWYHCSDMEVSKVDDRPKKRIKLDPEEDGKDKLSRDAYMLVYKRATAVPVAPKPPPNVIMEAIAADNVALQSEISDREKLQKSLGEEFDSLSAMKRDVLESLPGTDCIVPTEALSAWIKARSPDGEWDFSPLTCQHGHISPEATPSLKLISRAAFDKLSSYSTIPEMDICPTCVEDGFSQRNDKAAHANRVAEFDSLNDSSNGYVLPKSWLKAWRNGSLTPDTLPTDPKHTLFCHHGKPTVDTKNRQSVSGSGVALLRSLFGEFDVFESDAAECEACLEDAEAEQQDHETWHATIKQERAIRKQLNVQMFNTTNYLLPKKFFELWSLYLKRPLPRPELDLELCPHGKLDFDPQMESADYLTEVGWTALCRLYGHNPSDAVSVTLVSHPPEGKKEPVKDVSVETCEECRRARLSAYEKMWLPIVKGRNNSSANSSREPSLSATSAGTRRTRGNTSRAAKWQIEVDKDTTIKWIRTELYEMTKISPLSQRLYYGDRELDASDTIGSIGLLQGDHITLEEVLDVVDLVGDDDDDNGAGFGGTALVGRISCPQCTYSNEPGRVQCEMCEMPFSF